jgi:hypothetical protein
MLAAFYIGMVVKGLLSKAYLDRLDRKDGIIRG